MTDPDRPATDATGQAVSQAVEAERLRIVAGLIRLTGDWDLAEDCFMDAVERALNRWPADGIPTSPGAWLTTTARRRALDVLRRRQTEQDKLREMQALAELERQIDAADNLGAYGDDRLRMLFTCCHPALPMAGRVALTLKSVAGLSTREIARAFLVSEATMGQRLLRTRNKIAHAGIAFRVPEAHRLQERTAGVLAVVYLIFNEGYASGDSDGFRDDLATEAIQLAGLITRLLPDNDEAHALHALLLFQHSRRAARLNGDGELVTMEDQDRASWNRDQIAAARQSLHLARATGRRPGYYRLQAEIAGLHAAPATAAETDWSRIVMAYDALLEMHPSPIVMLNRAVAIGFRDGPQAALDLLDALDLAGHLTDYPLLPAIRADFLRRAGRRNDAAAAYREAIKVARTEPERGLLRRRLREVS